MSAGRPTNISLQIGFHGSPRVSKCPERDSLPENSSSQVGWADVTCLGALVPSTENTRGILSSGNRNLFLKLDTSKLMGRSEIVVLIVLEIHHIIMVIKAYRCRPGIEVYF